MKTIRVKCFSTIPKGSLKPFAGLLIVLFSTSCATMYNEPRTQTTIHTTQPSQIVYNNDTVRTFGNKIQLTATRKNEPLEIIAISDSTEKHVTINPQNSPAYYLNIICNYGIGMLVDKDKPERYGYPPRVYINSADTSNEYFKHSLTNNKDNLFLHFSLPFVNHFYLQPINEGAKTKSGFWGLTVGLDYYHGKNRFLRLSATAVSDYMLPFPAPIDYVGHHEFMKSAYVAMSHHHRVRRFILGYGVSYSQDTWELRYYDRFAPPPPVRDPVKKNSNAFGFICSSYYEAGESFNIGVVYRPTFLRPNLPQKFSYEHTISLDLAWKIRLRQ